MTEQEAFEIHMEFCKDNTYEVLACIGTAIETLSAYRNIESFREIVEDAYSAKEEYSEKWNKVYDYIQNYAKWNLEIEKRFKNSIDEFLKGGESNE